jgi:N,N'-diacetyllegionaminate synthase
VQGVRFIERALASPVDKEAMARRLEPMRALFGKSIVAARSLPAGYRLSEADLRFKKPGTGIPAAHAGTVIGRVLRRAVSADHLLAEIDLV